MRRWLVATFIVLVGLVTSALISPTRPLHAVDTLCFDVPGISNCISGGFRSYWESNGGLPVFGYPITGEFREDTPDGSYTVQYFERVRMEYHPENPSAFQVQLGRLGAVLYSQRPPREAPRAGCQYFAETGFNVCEPFRTKWESFGDKLGASSLDLYGLPISPLLLGSDKAGNPITLQWFERARFELHDSNQVLLGLLGREIRESGTPPPPTPPPPTPTPEPTPVPPPPPPPPINVPFPDRPCHVNVPDPVEGFQAWVTLPEVERPYDEVVCVRLIIGGEAAHPAFANVYYYTPNGVIAGTGHTTGLDGTASFIFYIGDIPPNTTVPVEAVATFEGREYRVWTSFIRR